MQIRQATLEDTQAISRMMRGRIERWQRMESSGHVVDLPYDELTLYERWLHGGAWMSVETAALWLNHLLCGGGLPLVAVEEDGTLAGYLEATIAEEAAPFGHHLHISSIVARDADSRDALMQAAIQHAQQSGRITASCTAYDQQNRRFYARYGLEPLTDVQQVIIPAQGGTVGFYKVTDHANADPAQIVGWQMPIGRVESARAHWEQVWPDLWRAVPQLASRRIHRLRFNASGQDAFVYVQGQLYNPRAADILCWTFKLPSAQLLAAIRDWTYKNGFRSLAMTVSEQVAALLGSEQERTPYQQIIMARDVR